MILHSTCPRHERNPLDIFIPQACTWRHQDVLRLQDLGLIYLTQVVFCCLTLLYLVLSFL